MYPCLPSQVEPSQAVARDARQPMLPQHYDHHDKYFTKYLEVRVHWSINHYVWNTVCCIRIPKNLISRI